MTLDLHRLEQLVAVAEEGSVTKAAARLHLSQQALSTSLRTLERAVGVELLDRAGPRITLLPAGEALVADARVIGGLAHTALRRARQIGRGEPEVLRLGHTPAVSGDQVADLLRRAQQQYPELRVLPQQRYPSELVANLLDGALDAGLTRSTVDTRGLAQATVAWDRLNVAVAARHPWAARSSVDIADIAGETLVIWGRPGESAYTDRLLALCRDAGFEPELYRSRMQGTPPETAVVETRNVAFVAAPVGPAAAGAAHVLELLPPAYVPLIALWPEHVSSDARDAFLAVAQRDQT